MCSADACVGEGASKPENIEGSPSSPLSSSLRPILGSKPEIVSAVVDLLADAGPRTTKDALSALFVMALYPLNRPKLVDGFVPALFSLSISSPIAGIVDDATAVAAHVAGCTESLDAFRAVSGFSVLLALLESGSDRAKENAAFALLNLARRHRSR